MAKLVSLDISSNKSGVALFIDGELCKHGVIDCHLVKDTQERSDDMTIKIMKTLDTWRPDIVYCEDTWNSVNPAAGKILTRIVGAVYGWCLVHGIEYKLILPTSWRSKIGFRQGPKVKRNELKQQSINYVKNRYGLILTDDEADAICIGCAVSKE